jgi:hypothetical protein
MNTKELPKSVELNELIRDLETPGSHAPKPVMKTIRRLGFDLAGWLSAALLALGASGCGAAEDMSESEQVGSTSQAISEFEKYAVAVMPLDAGACPADRVFSIYTDDEDDVNESDSTGWEAPGTARRLRNHNTRRGGTHWTFCKVDGRDFKSLTKFASKTNYFYAVLSVGEQCPNGSVDAVRIMDDEADNNQSSISPAGLANRQRNYHNGFTTVLSFCVFQASTDKMTSFPDLGMRYAVFHDYDAVQPSLFIQKRWVYSDNEDAFPAGSGSRTWYWNADPAAFDMMVSGDPNTMFDIGRVK